MKKLILLIFVVLFGTGNMIAQRDAELSDSVALGNFFDGLVNQHLRAKHVVGAVISVVKDGKVIFRKGYGYSNLEMRHPVSPDSTLFRIGSISKTFTWTAVMQLVEKGKLDLDEDINTYLKDFKIPDGPGGPITLRHIMTHTPGFEDRLINIFGEDERSLKPYGEILKEQLPMRVRPAGTELSYSNHGTGIAAYIVEQVSGMTWDDYVEQNIIKPLGMTRTTFRQPLPADLEGLQSSGYNWESGAFREYPFEYCPLAAVGGASSTATDIAKWMIMHLQHGVLGETRVIDSLSASMMQGLQIRVSPFVSGIGLGLYELINWNGIRTIGHGGDTFWFHSLMALLPEKNLGLFVSFNSQSADYAELFGLFLDHFYPLKPLTEKIKLSGENAERLTGVFRFNRYPHSDLMRLISMQGNIKISFDTTGCLLTRSADLQKWYPVNDSTFIRDDASDYIVFGKLEKGKYTRLFLGSLAVMPLERVPVKDTAGFNLMIMLIYMFVFLFTLLYWPLSHLARRNYIQREGTGENLTKGMKWSAWASALLVYIFFIGIIASLGNPMNIVYGVPSLMKAMLFIPLFLCALIVLLIYNAIRLIATGNFKNSGKFHYLLIIVSHLLFLWQLNNWNLLGFKY
ncbi:MAG: serine hydrolase domain-containing protein [Bacteroidales bacterium]